MTILHVAPVGLRLLVLLFGYLVVAYRRPGPANTFFGGGT